MSKIMQMCADEIAGYLKRIADLEAKLAESERQYQEYRQIVEKDIEKEVDERMRDTIKEFNIDISQLKQQLAEKDKRIRKLNLEAQRYYEDAYCNNFQAKVKTDFAIKQLEKVKKYADIDFRKNCYIDAVGLDKFIDNQIEELKKEIK